jgi:hypothetical protein
MSLSTWECGSYLYGPQELEVHFYSTRPKHEAMKMARADQGLRAGSSLSPTNGQSERVNQILEDMLRAYVLEHQGSWDHNLP